MSWCRWGTICPNNRTSNLYVYEGDYLFIHVAGRHIVNEENAPKVLPFWQLNESNVQEWLDWSNARDEWIKEHAIYEPIGLKYDGQSFCLNNKEDIKNTLDMLKEEGYNFPDYIYEYIEEFEDEDDNI
jgi:hypothetical protein